MAPPSRPRRTRYRLTDYPATYWTDAATSTESLTTLADLSLHDNLPSSSDTQSPEPTASSHTPICGPNSRNPSSSLQNHEQPRTDEHQSKDDPSVAEKSHPSEAQAGDFSDSSSLESFSGSEEDDHQQEKLGPDRDTVPDAEDETGGSGMNIVRLAEKVEFRDPRNEDKFMVLYRAALPDETRVDSLAKRGNWAVVMAGGGHFVAAIWDVRGKLVRHKTFHRYTSRKKQGGSQAAADQARGGGSRIRSAGSTLRRYGEQALQKEVHELLMEWESDFAGAQCVFVRASHREKRDLLLGWNESPLKACADRGVIRKIPIPAKRATLKEATRVYEELSTVRVSTESLAAQIKAPDAKKPEKQKLPTPKQEVLQAKTPEQKGTDHLKKREGKEKPPKPQIEPSEKEEVLEVDEELSELLKACLENDREGLSVKLDSKNELRQALFMPHYFKEDARFSKIEEALGLVGVACVCGYADLVTYLMDHDVSPTIGMSPYLCNKSKSIRTVLRKYWGLHPEKHDYKAAGIPSPLSQKEIEEMAERERERRRKDREKKKEKARERAEAAKSPEEKARELRAAAAEARMRMNR